MSDNTDLLRELYAAWNDGGIPAIADRFWADAVEWFDPPGLPDARSYRGREAVARHLQEWIDSLGAFSFKITVDRFLETAAETIAFLWVEGGIKSGLSVPKVRFIHVVEIRDARVIRIRAYLHAAEALEAAGIE